MGTFTTFVCDWCKAETTQNPASVGVEEARDGAPLRRMREGPAEGSQGGQGGASEHPTSFRTRSREGIMGNDTPLQVRT